MYINTLMRQNIKKKNYQTEQNFIFQMIEQHQQIDQKDIKFVQKTKDFIQKLISAVTKTKNQQFEAFFEDVNKLSDNQKFAQLASNLYNKDNTLKNPIIKLQNELDKANQKNQKLSDKPQHSQTQQQKTQIMGQQLERHLNQNKQLQSKSSLLQVKQYVKNLQQNLSVKSSQYEQKQLQQFVYLVNEIYQNNKYLFKQISFEKLKQLYSRSRTPFKTASNKRKLSSDNQNEFNLQLTMKSKLSKNSVNLERQDSLIYSNATSFGLKSTQNKSKDLRNNSSKSIKNNGQNHNNDIQLIIIDKTSSKGDVQNQERFSSAQTLSDNQKVLKLPPKMSYENRSDRSNQSIKKFQQDKKNQRKNTQFSVDSVKSPIKEQDHYQIEPVSNTKEKLFNSNMKKSFSIKSHSKMSNSEVKSRKGDQVTVFSTQMQHLQIRMSRLKQQKLIKKRKLQQQLAKINRQIDIIKKQQNKVEQKKIVPQNTFESRIQINDDFQSKKQAVKLIKNIRMQKQSRQKMRRKDIKVLDEGLHEQVKQIMQLRYFNEERIKQKRKLEIIERMKKQQMRKIQYQKQVQVSNQFLLNLKQQNSSSNQGLSKVKLNKNNDSPMKNQQRQNKQINIIHQTPTLYKKKANLPKIRNLTIIKKSKQDLYEQVLS